MSTRRANAQCAPGTHLCEEPLLRGASAREAKIADLEVAVGVQQQVGRLQVAVKHVGGVNVLQAAQNLRRRCVSNPKAHVRLGGRCAAADGSRGARAACARQQGTRLVHKVLAVLVRERLRRADDLVQVCVHQLIHQVHVVELGQRGRAQHVVQRHDVVVAQVAQQLYLAQRASRVCCVLESVANLLDGHAFVAHRVGRAAHHAVGALAQRFDGRVAQVQLRGRCKHIL